MEINEKIDKYVLAQGNQVGSGAELAGILKEMVEEMPGPPGPQGPQGPQGNTGSSVDYPFELVNNLTTDDPEKGLSAAQGVVLKGEISQLGQEVDNIFYEKKDDITIKSTSLNYQLTGEGGSSENSSAKILKYQVTAGELIYLKLSKDTAGVYQFQNDRNVPSLPPYPVVGTPVTTAEDAFITVPTGATYLIVSCLKTNSTNEVKGAIHYSLEGMSVTLNKLDKEINGRTNLPIFQEVSGWKLDGDGKSSQGTGVRIRKYAVVAGERLYIKLSKDTAGVYQFQSDYSVPSSLPNSYLVGTPVTTAIDGFVIVPTGATYLIVSEFDTNTTNVVQRSEPENVLDPIRERVDELENTAIELDERVDELEEDMYGVDSPRVLSLSEIGIGLNGEYMNNQQLKPSGASNCCITNPVYLKKGDVINCQTGGTGLALFFSLPNGKPITTSTQASQVLAYADAGTVVTYSHTITQSEEGWYGFSGRTNRNDGTNLVVSITRVVDGKGVSDKIENKADKNEVVGDFGLLGLSVGADEVKDAVPNTPWFDSVANDGTTYGTYLDDKLDSVPFGDSFIFITDVHYPGNAQKSAKIIDYARRRLGIKTIIHGGDVLNEAATIAEAASQWLNFNRDFVFRMGGDFKQVVGDHDHNGGTGHENLPYEFIQRMLDGYNAKELVFDNLYDSEVAGLGWSASDMSQYDAWKRMHYYFDDMSISTRFIVLHTGWTGASGLAGDKLGAASLDESYALRLQMDFVHESLMTTPQGFNVVVVGHNVVGNPTVLDVTPTRYNTQKANYKGLWKQIIRHLFAFKNKFKTPELEYRSWSMAQVGYKSYDYSNAPDVGKLLCVGGDVHWDILAKAELSSATLSVISSGSTIDPDKDVINVVTMTDGDDRDYLDENGNRICPPATPGTIDSQAFDIVTIAKDGIHFTRIGCGNDRVVYFNP